MAGPHRTTGQGAALLTVSGANGTDGPKERRGPSCAAPAQPGCLKIRGKNNASRKRTAGVGPDFQVVGGEGCLCRSRGPGHSWTTEGGGRS